MIINCSNCGIEIEQTNHLQRYCEKCKQTYHRDMYRKKYVKDYDYVNKVPFKCKLCGKEFIRNHPVNIYCSKECKAQVGVLIKKKKAKDMNYINKVPYACVKCGELFIRTHPGNKYCSVKCSKKAKYESIKRSTDRRKGIKRVKVDTDDYGDVKLPFRSNFYWENIEEAESLSLNSPMGGAAYEISYN